MVSLARNRLTPSAYSKKVTLGKGSRTELQKVIVGIRLPFQWKSLPPPCFCHRQMLNALVFLGCPFLGKDTVTGATAECCPVNNGHGKRRGGGGCG